MKATNSLVKLSALGLAAIFGIFLLHGVLTSSDFPRGMRAGGTCGPGHWSSLDSLNINRNWGPSDTLFPSLNDYLDTCNHWGIRPMLNMWRQSIPNVWIWHNSYGQDQHYEAEMKYSDASQNPFRDFYFFWHHDTVAQGQTPVVIGSLDPYFPGQGAASWKCAVKQDPAGVMLLGPGKPFGANNG